MSLLKRWRTRAAAATSLAATAALALTLLVVSCAVLLQPWLPQPLCIGAMLASRAPQAGQSAAPVDDRGALLRWDIAGTERAVHSIGLGIFWIEDQRDVCVPLNQMISTQPLLFASAVALYFGSFFLLLWIFMVIMPGVLALGLAAGLLGVLLAAVALVGVVALPAAPLLLLLWWLLRKPAGAATPPA